MMDDPHPLPLKELGVIFAMGLDGQGGGEPIPAPEALTATPDATHPLWIHLDRNDDDAREWLRDRSGLATSVIDMLLADEPRPRAIETASGVALVLRGMNLTGETDPEDMLTLRGWFEPGRIITVRIWRVMSVRAVRHQLLEGIGPTDTGAVMTALVEGVVSRITEAVVDLEEEAEALSDEIEDGDGHDGRTKLRQVSRKVVSIRRHVVPQREALPTLAAVRAEWLTDANRARLSLAAERSRREVETLDAVREQVNLTEQALLAASGERLNRTTFALTIVATLFLPITFVTGMLGMNVGGLPLANSPSGFVITTAVLLALLGGEAALLWWMLRRK